MVGHESTPGTPRFSVVFHAAACRPCCQSAAVALKTAQRRNLSLSRRGNCWDNAVAESFFSSLKKERIRKRIYKTRILARAGIFGYVEVFYNRTRWHSHLGPVNPEAFERASL